MTAIIPLTSFPFRRFPKFEVGEVWAICRRDYLEMPSIGHFAHCACQRDELGDIVIFRLRTNLSIPVSFRLYR